MSNREAERLARAIGGTVVVLVASIILVSAAANHPRLELGDVAIVGLALLPLIAALAFSGVITELTGPGGIGAKFEHVAKQPVELSTETIESSMLPMRVVEKADVKALQQDVRAIDLSSPFVLTLVLKEGGYRLEALRKYLEVLTKYHSFKAIVVLSEEDRVDAIIPVAAMWNILNLFSLAHGFVDAVNDGQISTVRQYPGILTETIDTDTTNVEALRKMTEQNVGSLIVVDNERRLLGIVERDQILSKLMLAIAGE